MAAREGALWPGALALFAVACLLSGVALGRWVLTGRPGVPAVVVVEPRCSQLEGT